MSVDTRQVTIEIPGAEDTILVMKAPAAANGGAVRILEASAVNHATTSSTVSYTVALHRYSAAGTPAVNGTIAAAIGGTSDHWADGVPKSFTIDSTYGVIGAGEWLALVVTAQNAGTATRGRVTLSLVNGK